MYGDCISDFGCADDGGNVEVAFGRTGRSDTYGFISQADMHKVAIGAGVHGNGFDAEFFAGAQNAEGDFAAVGNQDFFKHWC
jgi:hypothetical protein